MHIHWDNLGGAVSLYTVDLNLNEIQLISLGDGPCLLEVLSKYGNDQMLRHVYAPPCGPYELTRARKIVQWIDEWMTGYVGAERSHYGEIVLAYRLNSGDNQVWLASYAAVPHDIAGLDPMELPMRVPEAAPQWYTDSEEVKPKKGFFKTS